MTDTENPASREEGREARRESYKEERARREDDLRRRREIGLRSQKRALDSRERSQMRVVSGAYGYTIYALYGNIFRSLLLNNNIIAIVSACLVAAYIYALVRMWRSKPVNSWILAAPCIAFLLLSLPFQGWLGLPFWCNAVAAGALLFLVETRREIAELPN